MTQYIDKAAVIVEIKKLIDEIYAGRPFDSLSSEQQTALWYVKSMMSSINTIEVKEVDLEKEMSEYFVEHSDEFFSDKYKLFAKHFYELGVKAAQKGE